ncbi:MAG: thioredoxin family protein [Bacillota bacterium]
MSDPIGSCILTELVLGPACANCNRLQKAVAEAAKELGAADPAQNGTEFSAKKYPGIRRWTGKNVKAVIYV